MKRLILLVTLFSIESTWAACDYRLNIANATLEIMDNPQVVQQNFTLSRGNSNSPKCYNYRVFFSKGLANNYQRKAFTLSSSSVDYNLHKTVNQAGILKDFADAVSPSEYVDGITQDGNTPYTNRFFVSVPGQSGNVIRSGTYADIVQANLYSVDTNHNRLEYEGSEPFTVLFFVPKKVQVSLVDEGGVFDSSSTSKVLDFGYLSLNQEKGADLRIVSNGSYQVKVTSQNSGALKHPRGESISYAMRVNGNNIPLNTASSAGILIGSGSITSNAGDLYNLKIKIIENPQNKTAGMYQDVLTLTAIAN